MMHNRFLAKCGVSLACLVSVWGMGAYAKTTELFRFPVNIPAGANGCSAKITAASNGCTNITERALDTNGNCQDTSNVRTVCPGEQGPQGAGCVTKSLTTNTDSQTLVLTCGTGSNAEDTTITIPNGQGCAVSRVDTTATGKNIIMACGNSSTTIPVENGTNCNLTVATDSTTRNVSVTKSCGDETPTTVQILNHQNLVNDAATATANKIIQDGTFTTPSDVESAIGGAITTAALKTKLDTEYANLATTNTALAGKVDTSALNDYYNKTEVNSEINSAIAEAELGELDDEAVRQIVQDVMGDTTAFVTTQTYSNYVTSNDAAVAGKLNKSDLATELGKTTNANAINSIINSNSTVTGLQSTLSTVQTTANNALPKNQLATEVGKLGYASASDLSSLQTTLSTVQTTANNALPAANFGTTLKSAAQSSNLATALEATAPTATINGIIDTNSTVAGKASQSALDTLTGRVTANEAAIAALPNEERVAQIAANAANAAALCTGTITTRETPTENGKTVEVICTTND